MDVNQAYTTNVVHVCKVRGGSMLEPPRTSARAPCTPCSPCKDVVREGSVQSNHPELISTNLASISALKVRGGSMHLNHPKLVHKHPANLVSTVKM